MHLQHNTVKSDYCLWMKVHTYPYESRKSLAIVSNSKIIWFWSYHFHNVFIELCLFSLENKHERP